MERIISASQSKQARRRQRYRRHRWIGLAATVPLLIVGATGFLLAAEPVLRPLWPPLWAEPWTLLLRLHRSLAAGDAGKIVMSLAGMAMLPIWVSGWLVKGRVRGGRASRHSMLGAYLGLPLAMICLLGALLNFSEPLANWLDPLVSASAELPSLDSVPSAASAQAVADQLRPPGELEQVYPAKAGRPYLIFLYRDDMRIYVAGPTARLLKIRAPGRHWTSALYPLHLLKPLGWFGRLLLLSAAVGLLCVCGHGLATTRHAVKSRFARRRPG